MSERGKWLLAQCALYLPGHSSSGGERGHTNAGGGYRNLTFDLFSVVKVLATLTRAQGCAEAWGTWSWSPELVRFLEEEQDICSALPTMAHWALRSAYRSGGPCSQGNKLTFSCCFQTAEGETMQSAPGLRCIGPMLIRAAHPQTVHAST